MEDAIRRPPSSVMPNLLLPVKDARIFYVSQLEEKLSSLREVLLRSRLEVIHDDHI